MSDSQPQSQPQLQAPRQADPKYWFGLIDDEGIPEVFHGISADASVRWDGARGHLSRGFKTREEATTWLIQLCERMARQYQRAAEVFRFAMRPIFDPAPGVAASGSVSVAEAACDFDGECDE